MTRGERNLAWIEGRCLKCGVRHRKDHGTCPKHGGYFTGLCVPEGKHVGNPLKLLDWEKEAIKEIYDNPHGTRTAVISVGKKNGKTTLAAALLLLHLVGPEAVPSTEIPSTGQSKEQAGKLYRLAASMVRHTSLSETGEGGLPWVVCRDTVKQLQCPTLGTLYTALSAEASTAHGGSAIFAVHDELGQVRGPVSELYDAVENAMSAHDEPLSVVISTQAPTDADLLSTLIDDARKGLDPHTVLILYESDPKANPFSEKTIKQANPAFGHYQNAKEIRKLANRAKRLPSVEALYRNYNLNQRVEASNPFVTASVWDANAGSFSAWRTVYGGLDLSETNDLTALVLVSPVRGYLHVRSVFWLPAEGIDERSRADRVPYNIWAKKGLIQLTPGHSVEYSFVAQYLVELFDTEDIRHIAFDRWNMRHLKPLLIRAGMSEPFVADKFVDFGQGYQSMSPALRNLESLLLNKKVRHGGHPVLQMCARNAVVKMDEAGGRKLDKKRARGRIDGMVALAMASAMASEDFHQGRVLPVDESSFLEDLGRQGASP